MPNRTIVATTALLAAMSTVTEADAQGYRQFNRWCYGEASPERTIQGCDAVIRWARETPRDTGTAFYNRGLALVARGQLDRAIDDYGHAIRDLAGAAHQDVDVLLPVRVGVVVDVDLCVCVCV